MNTRSALWVAAAAVAAGLLAWPHDARAERPPIRLQHEVAFDSEPEVPNVTSPRSTIPVRFEPAPVENTRSEKSPATRQEDWLRRVLRILRSLTLGGLAR